MATLRSHVLIDPEHRVECDPRRARHQPLVPGDHRENLQDFVHPVFWSRIERRTDERSGGPRSGNYHTGEECEITGE